MKIIQFSLVFLFLLAAGACAVPGNGNNVTAPSVDAKIKVSRISPVFVAGEIAISHLAVTDDCTIFGVGYDGVNPRLLRYSKDFGATWQQRPFTDGFTMPTAIYFTDSQNGWIGGNRQIFRTTDGGVTWRGFPLNTEVDFAEISFADAKTGIMAGRRNIAGSIRSEVYTTSDGGVTWRHSYSNREWNNPFSVLAVDARTALLVLSENHLLRTVDGGRKWLPVENFTFRTNRLIKAPDGRIWAVGRDGTFLASRDGGMTWSRPQTFPDGFESREWGGVAFVSRTVGIGVGGGGSIVLTRDGGDSWKSVNAGISDDLIDVAASDCAVVLKSYENLYRLELTDE